MERAISASLFNNRTVIMERALLKPMFKVDEITEDEKTGKFFAVLKYRDVDGVLRPITIPRADLDRRNVLTETLKNHGAYFSAVGTPNTHALQGLAQSIPNAKRSKSAAHVGWYEGGYTTFVLPHRVIGGPPSGVSLRPPRKQSPVEGTKLLGDHAGWARTVAAGGRFSSRMVLGISAALAAPLLKMAGIHPFVILIHGQSKIGKSTMLLSAASVIGYGDESDLPNFRATDAAFGEMPAAFNDSLLPLNELGSLKGSARDRYQRLRDIAYGFADGVGTTYSSMATNTPASRLKWHSIALATGEETLADIARAAHEIRKGGEAIRFIDLAAAREGSVGIFDRIPKNVSEGETADWIRQQCNLLRDGCRRNHGAAIEHFIEQVIAHPEKVKRDLMSLREKFVGTVRDVNDDAAVGHLAECFGHIYAAGVLGVRLGTLPWSEQLVRKCIKRCYYDARRELNTEADLLHQGRRILRKKIAALPKKRAWKKSADGFVTRTKVGKVHTATIAVQEFKSWFPDERQPNLVLTWLRSKNALQSRAAAKPGNAVGWADSQPKWPDGKRPHSIVIDMRAQD
ncbi:MAG: DUF927 domain-containing protein [Xanthobacteraceae bacterium]